MRTENLEDLTVVLQSGLQDLLKLFSNQNIANFILYKNNYSIDNFSTQNDR